MDKNAVELVQNQKSLGFSKAFSWCQDPEQSQTFPQGTKIQNGDTGNHQDIPPTRGVGFLNGLQGCLLPYTNTGTVQEISDISRTGSVCPLHPWSSL